MDHENYFFLIFSLTVIIIRVFLYFKPVASPTIKDLRLHHWMLGVAFDNYFSFTKKFGVVCGWFGAVY